MPVILEQISDPSAEDRNDLIKLYQDYPNHLLSHDPDELYQWLNEQLNGDQQLFTGRFNGRIIAAIWATPTNTTIWQLNRLCVRAITRRRSAARQLLTLLIKQSQQQYISLFMIDDPLLKPLEPLLNNLGFQQTELAGYGQCWQVDAA